MVMDGGSVISQQAMQQANSIHAGQEQSGDNPFYSRVAREFVRQYYTILHESPVHLHRFYNDESDFIHGSIDSPAKAVRGQDAIHRTIVGLNFHNCFAKILYVDAQESVDKSVVVQVAGELSNSGGPMRRFMQTFLLVPLSTRKYYVRNDIFRYQDEIYLDDQDEMNANEVQNTSGPTLVNGSGEVGTTNGTADPKDDNDSNQWDNSIASAQTATPQPSRAKSPPSQTSSAQETSSTPPVKSAASWSQMVQKPAEVAPTSNAQVQPSTGFGQATTFGGATAQGHQRLKTGQPQRPNGSLPPKKETPVKPKEEDTKPAIPDNQQLFVGNIPVEVTESNLVDLFTKYGKVLEFKLGLSKNGVGKNTPNYGFVVFESADTVQKFLKNKEEHFELPDGKSIRLNIEEKKPRGAPKGNSRLTGPPRDRRQMSNGNKRDFGGRDGRDNGRPPRTGAPRQSGGQNLRPQQQQQPQQHQ